MNRRDAIASALAGLIDAAPNSAMARAATPARHWLDRWSDAFNAADARVYDTFIRTHSPTLIPYLDEDLGLRDASGGATILSVSERSETEVEAVVRDRTWDRVSRVTLTAASERMIDDIAFSGATAPEGVAIPRGGEAEVLGALRERLDPAAEAGRWSGVALVAEGGRAPLLQAWGHADAESRILATPETRYCIGSMGKMFTAVAVMQLVEDGHVRLDDVVGDHLPDYPDRTIAERVTVEQLLTHTGGTGDIFGPEYDARADELTTPSGLIALYGGRPPAFEPGSRWGYSNYGFVLLGAIIEAAAGESYPDYLRRRVFAPAEMASTSLLAGEATATPLVGCAWHDPNATHPAPRPESPGNREDLESGHHARPTHERGPLCPLPRSSSSRRRRRTASRTPAGRASRRPARR